ncbi:DUF4238 domain-containing protein [Serratia ureilytica]|uniref:DUF4238 domain-containing protein n=1 Tax=Serratia ureilytica TaxID=300181 RepID=UPI0018A8B37D|nr:DUF4238 domain-containing protein [Serratia ureilytica]
MAMKKNQHLVPVCYLKNFLCDLNYEHSDNENFEPGIYISNNKLSSGWKMRGLRHGSLTKSNFYNMADDDPNSPKIEDFLSKIESCYQRNFTRIERGEIDDDNMFFMSYFTTIQIIRVEVFIKSMQDVFDKVANWLDAFSGVQSYSEMFKDSAKRQILSIKAFASMHLYSNIIYNETDFPFITSDNPVVNRTVNVKDLIKVIPINYIADHTNNSDEFQFIFFPLSPKVAYVSCKLIDSKEKMVINEMDIGNIFFLNLFSIYNAREGIYSSIKEPIKGEAELSKYLIAKSGLVIKIYTNDDRIISNGEIVRDSDSTLTIKAHDLLLINGISEGEYIKLVEVMKNGESIRGLRECKVLSINYNNGLITFKSNLPFEL